MTVIRRKARRSKERGTGSLLSIIDLAWPLAMRLGFLFALDIPTLE